MSQPAQQLGMLGTITFPLANGVPLSRSPARTGGAPACGGCGGNHGQHMRNSSLLCTVPTRLQQLKRTQRRSLHVHTVSCIRLRAALAYHDFERMEGVCGIDRNWAALTVVTGELAIQVAGGVVLGEGAQELGAVRACRGAPLQVALAQRHVPGRPVGNHTWLAKLPKAH